jgi:hypothetical protein
MKKSLLLLCLLIGSNMNAQIDIGLRAGASLTSARIKNFTENASIRDFSHETSELSYQAGIYARVKVLSLFVQGELYFSQINHSAVASFQNLSLPPKNIDLSFSRIDLPLLLGLKIGPARIMGGPIFSANFNDISGNLKNDLSIASVGYQIGIGAEFKSLFIDLRYEAGLGNWANSVLIENNSYDADLKTSQFLLCLGFELF